MTITPQPDAAARHRGATITSCPVRHRTPEAVDASGGAIRVVTVLYGAVSYLMFLAVFGYAIGFVADIAVPRSIDRAIEAPLGQRLFPRPRC